MGLIKELLGQVKDNQRYAREHPRTYQDDYSSSSSRPRRIRYTAYCRICGACTKFGSFTYDYASPGEATKALQAEYNCKTEVPSHGCGQFNHSPVVQEVEK